MNSLLKVSFFANGAFGKSLKSSMNFSKPLSGTAKARNMFIPKVRNYAEEFSNRAKTIRKDNPIVTTKEFTSITDKSDIPSLRRIPLTKTTLSTLSRKPIAEIKDLTSAKGIATKIIRSRYSI